MVSKDVLTVAENTVTVHLHHRATEPVIQQLANLAQSTHLKQYRVTVGLRSVCDSYLAIVYVVVAFNSTVNFIIYQTRRVCNVAN